MFAGRRQKLLEAMGPDAVALFVGARPATRSNDTEYPFRQDSDFWYLTGYGHPNAVAVLRTDGGPEFTLFVEPRDPDMETWTGYRPGVEGAVADYGGDRAFAIGELAGELPEILSKATRVYHSLGRNTEIDAQLISILEDMRKRSRTGVIPAAEIVDPRSQVHELRLIKEPAELDLMRRAASITAEAHREAAHLAQAGRNEYELQAALEYAFRRLGGNGPAYGTIVGGGVNATVLHYVANDRPLVDGDLVLIDAGAEFENYASDVTRTYPVGGTFRGEARAVYEVVLEAQERALAECKPGNDLDAIHDTALRSLVGGMIDLGWLDGSVEESIETGSYKPFYMHRTSHWLGLDVHDSGAYTADGTPRKLEPGMAFTIEPGLYVSANTPDGPAARFRGIGVRIEDDVVVTPGGIENLNSAIPKHPDEIENWVREGLASD
ncbi:MAG: aminopeptidase P N-terminal domain-containing protein [Myxococcota bacterium]|nr:aminopeptidase P N-terminal domain-containing protein [Myxococcota bacterium]